jgi:hypothetical protein
MTRTAQEEALEPRRALHGLRQTFGTRMAAGVSLQAFREWMGQCDYHMTSIYADDAPDLICPTRARAPATRRGHSGGLIGEPSGADATLETALLPERKTHPSTSIRFRRA